MSRLFGFDEEESQEGNLSNGQDEKKGENNEIGTTLQDAINFTEELQSYYYNDICKMQADLVMQSSLSEQEVRVANKKVRQDQITLNQIDKILNRLKDCMGRYQDVWKKAVYSFYTEIEKQQMVTTQENVFAVLLELSAVNTKPELAEIIAKRLASYHKAWNIAQELEIPQNYNVILTEGKDGIENYHFGNFSKQVYTQAEDVELTEKQLDQIRNMKVDLEAQVPTEEVWVYVANSTRLQLNFMRRTCFVRTTWECKDEDDSKLFLDVVKVCDFEQYIKGVLQIVFTKNRYAIVSLVVPTDGMLRAIGPTLKEEGKVQICKRLRFILKERSNLYKGCLKTQRLDRRNLPEELQFVSYPEFRKKYFY